MIFLEIIGTIALYILCCIAVLYAAMALIGTFMRGGLEVVGLMAYVAIGILALSALGGAFLLGALL